MGASQSNTTSGGGAATPVANDFQSWLHSQLNGGSYNGSVNNVGATQGLYFNPGTGHWEAPPSSGARPPGSSNPNIGLGQGGSPFQNAFNSQLSGQLLDPSGSNAAIASGIANGPNTFGQNFGNTYTGPDYNQANLSQLGTNLLQGSGMADLSGIGQTAQSNFDIGQGSSQYSSILNQLLGQGQQLAGQGGGSASAGQASIGAGIALDPATQFDMNDPYFAALKQQQERALQQATAANNARFGAQGAGAIGSGAQLANSNLQSAASADQTVALQQALQGLQQQDLAERGTRANVGLTSRGQDAQVGIANAGNTTQANIANLQAMVQGQGQNNSLLSSMLAATGQARGQDFQDSQLRMQSGLEQSLKNAGFTNDRNAQDLVAMIQNQGLGNVFQTNSAAQNSLNQQNNNLNSINTTNQQNNFNQANALNSSNAQNFSNNLNSNNFQSNQNNWIQQLAAGQGVNSMANQNVQNALNQLFNSFGQSTSIGIQPQQTTTNTSTPWWQSALGSAIPAVAQGVGSWWSNRNNNNAPVGGGTTQTRYGGP